MKTFLLLIIFLIVSINSFSQTKHSVTATSPDGKMRCTVYYTSQFDEFCNLLITVNIGSDMYAKGIKLYRVRCRECGRVPFDPNYAISYKNIEKQICVRNGVLCCHNNATWDVEVWFDENIFGK
jgi:hypothetical protein